MADETSENIAPPDPGSQEGVVSTQHAATSVGGLTQRLMWAWEQKREDHEYALIHRSDPTGEDDKGRLIYAPPAWSAEDMGDGPHGENPEFVLEELADESLRNALLRCFDKVEPDFDYRDPDSGTSPEDRALVNAHLERALDSYEALTENQRQAMIDWGHYQPRMKLTNEMRKAVNVEAQQTLNTLFFLAGMRGAFDSHVERRQRVNGLMTDAELEATYQLHTDAALSTMVDDKGQPGAVVETIEKLKWEGVLDHNGQPRPEPIPDMSHLREGNEAYHPAVHAEFTGWRPGDDGWGPKLEPLSESELVFQPGHFGGSLWLSPPGEEHPLQVPESELAKDPHNPARIEDYVGQIDPFAPPVPIPEDSVGLELALQVAGMALRYDTRSGALQYTYHDPRSTLWERMDDNAEGALWDAIARLCVFERSNGGTVPARFVGQVRTDSRNTLQHKISVDAFARDYLYWLPDWDGINRVDTVLEDIFDLDTTLPDWKEMSVAAAKSILLGAILRIKEPGAKLDEIAVLIGPQGCGKSLFSALLVPERWRQHWFSDALILRSSGQHRDQAQSLLGRVIMECGEMAGMSRADVDGLKAFLARQTDHIRLPYDRLVSEFPRRCIIVGTSNDDQILPNDPTGLRRFLPVRIRDRGPHPIVHRMDELRDQLWAETKHRIYECDERPTITEDVRAAQQRSTEASRRSDEIVEDLVEAYAGTKTTLTLHEVLEHVSAKTENLKPQHLEGRVRYALKQSGFASAGRTPRSAPGPIRRVWKREPATDTTPASPAQEF